MLFVCNLFTQKPLHFIFPACFGLLEVTINEKKMLPDKAAVSPLHFSKRIISSVSNHSCYAS